MKLTIALILALQVSVCVWAQEWPQPEKELVDKYEDLKATFLKRLVNAWQKVHSSVQPALEGSPTGTALKEVLEELQKNPRVESVVKILNGLGSEMEPVKEKARMALLGAYGQYLRPHIGEYLDTAIKNIKPVLDTVMPQDG